MELSIRLMVMVIPLLLVRLRRTVEDEDRCGQVHTSCRPHARAYEHGEHGPDGAAADCVLRAGSEKGQGSGETEGKRLRLLRREQTTEEASPC